jgi:diguanylate cyclase (GGDEF)-like protein/PAS domain S-box-containing protein
MITHTSVPLRSGNTYARFRQYWAAHWVGCIVVLVVLIGMVGTTFLARRASQLSDLQSGSEQAKNVANQLAERTAQLIRRADQLSSLAARHPGRYSAQELLVDGEDNSAVILVDRSGRVTDSTLLPVGTDVSATPYFKRARAGAGAELGLVRPQKLVAGGSMLLPTIRRTHDLNGKFAGAVIIAVQASHITDSTQLSKHPDALFALLDENGRLLAGTTGDVALGLLQLTPHTLKQLRAQAGAPVAPQLAGIGDSELRLTVLAPVAPYPLAVLVGIPLATATADADALFKGVWTAVCLLGAAVVAGTLLAQRQNDRLQETLDAKSAVEAALWEEKEFLDVTLSSIDDAVFTLDKKHRVTFLNRRAEEMTGWSAADAVGRDLHEIATLHELPTTMDVGRFAGCAASEDTPPLLAGGMGEGGVACLTNKVGSRVSVEYAATELTRQHAGAHSVLVLHDVSQATKMAHSLTYQASHDALTGLFNRTAFDAKVDAALLSANTSKHEHVLLFLDLDQFKVVNDSCGHAAGDELLKQVAYLFQQNMRQSDMLARMGGDEFAVLLENCAPGPAMRLANKLRNELTAFRFSWGEKNFQVGVSIGAVPITAACGTRDDLMRRADTACYIAKDGGRNRTHLYLDADEAVVARQGEMSWAARVQHALANDEFLLVGQRIIAPQGGPGYYYEMLLRMVDQDGSLIPPMAFLPAAERYGLMPAVDRAVINLALREHKELQAATTQPVRLAINLSGSSLSDLSLLEFIRNAFEEHGVPAHSVCFELTETVAIANLQVAANMMRQLKELGCTLALDDFGSGMSSFSYLKQLPVDVVKIDGSFVRNMLGNTVDYAMVEAVNNIAHKMGLATLAEYVESPALIQALDEMGVDLLQGYGVSRPQSLAEMHESVRNAPPGPCPSLTKPGYGVHYLKMVPALPYRSERSTK